TSFNLPLSDRDFGAANCPQNARVLPSQPKILRSMEGKRYRNGKPSPVLTYKGWTLAAWADKNKDAP
ncbi:MAG: hypothetical protein Q4E56_05245, partial [Pseudomonadota bacterium]|nr:hypothetical protein [Pseudomonadota bacterium]